MELLHIFELKMIIGDKFSLLFTFSTILKSLIDDIVADCRPCHLVTRRKIAACHQFSIFTFLQYVFLSNTIREFEITFSPSPIPQPSPLVRLRIISTVLINNTSHTFVIVLGQWLTCFKKCRSWFRLLCSHLPNTSPDCCNSRHLRQSAAMTPSPSSLPKRCALDGGGG